MRKRTSLALIALALTLLLVGCGTESEETTEPSTEVVGPVTLDEAFQGMQSGIADLEEASSARVDKIAMIAKADAAGINDDLGNEACVFIIENFPDFYTDNETMEKVMYCGCILEYGYTGSDVAKLGQDTVQAVKYVYRGAESVEDDATQENLRQIKELLDEKLK